MTRGDFSFPLGHFLSWMKTFHKILLMGFTFPNLFDLHIMHVFRTLPTSSQKYSRYTRWRWTNDATIFDRILDLRRIDFDRIIFFSEHERTKAYCWNAQHHMNLKYTCNDSEMLSSILPQCFICNQDIVPERMKNAFLGGASRKLIRRCSENRRKGVMYNINIFAVISHSIPFGI